MQDISIQPLTASDRDWVARFSIQQWGASTMIAHGVVYELDTLPGFVAIIQGERIGLLTYHIQGGACEIASLNSTRPGQGVGTVLIEAAKKVARQAACQRLWLITTNDNLNALRFYQKRGFELVAVHRNAIAESRKLKPLIPLIGNDGIPLRDEIELELCLEP